MLGQSVGDTLVGVGAQGERGNPRRFAGGTQQLVEGSAGQKTHITSHGDQVCDTGGLQE